MCDFRNISIVEALRVFLELFNLPGESQQVDRIIEIFANKYQLDNPKVFRSANGAYTFSYLLIMLQTDLYNPNVSTKMTFMEFNKLARSINDGEDVTQEVHIIFKFQFLHDCYYSISQKPLALHEKDEKKSLSELVQANFSFRLDAYHRDSQRLQGTKILSLYN